MLELIEGVDAYLYPVGRLDVDTSGLLILTNDGDFTKLLTHPSHQVDKTYVAVVQGKISAHNLSRLEKGLRIEEGTTAPASARLIRYSRSSDTSAVEITIHEGRKRQVRRMFEVIGHAVTKLSRVRIGKLNLEGLSEGSSDISLQRKCLSCESSQRRQKRNVGLTQVKDARKHVALIVLAAACVASQVWAYPLQVRDARGKAVTIKARPARIVSLAPNITEILYAIGAGDQVAGRHEILQLPSRGREKAKSRRRENDSRGRAGPEARSGDRSRFPERHTYHPARKPAQDGLRDGPQDHLPDRKGYPDHWDNYRSQRRGRKSNRNDAKRDRLGKESPGRQKDRERDGGDPVQPSVGRRAEHIHRRNAAAGQRDKHRVGRESRLRDILRGNSPYPAARA